MKEVYDVSSGKTYFLSEDGHGNYYALDIPQNGNGYLIFLILLYGAIIIYCLAMTTPPIVTKDYSKENSSSSYSTDYSSSDTKFPEYYYSNTDD